MKKIICILIAALMAFTFAACSDNGSEIKETTESTTEMSTEIAGTLEEIAAEMYTKTTTIEMMLMEPIEIDLTDPDAVKSYLGIDSADSIERAVFSEPMIGSIAYSMSLVTVKDGSDVEALKSQILEGINYRKWLCVAAEKVLVTSCGSTVMMVMAQEEIVDDVYNAFNSVANGAASSPLTKIGEIQEEYPEGGLIIEDDVILG